jgi:hypothetical protein
MASAKEVGMRSRSFVVAVAAGWMCALAARAGTVEDVQARFASCDRTYASAEARQDCHVKVTPRLCRSELTRNSKNFYSPIVQRRWYLCLSQCDRASLASRTAGECSTRGTPPVTH